jgi:aminopeptidase N
MKPIFGPQTERLQDFLADLRNLSPAEVDRVTSAWKEVADIDRAEAWAQLQRATTQNERYPIVTATSAARRTAMDTAHRFARPDWAFWAAASDAAAAITADDRIGSNYDILTAPLATVMPSLARSRSSAKHAAQAPAPEAPQASRASQEPQSSQARPAPPVPPAPRLPSEPVRPRGGRS